MTENHFDEEVAANYDRDAHGGFEPAVLDPIAEFLARLAGDGRALEFGIGTGRVALALRERGVDVAGIDLSPQMVSRLRAKPGGDDIEVAIGDFATTKVAGEFGLVYLVINTIMNLTTQDEQVACFENAAAHLGPGGHFVVEVGIPDLQLVPAGETFKVFASEPGYVGFDEYDLAGQGLISHHIRFEGERVRRTAVPFRYVWPAEMDLMARIAGLTPAGRWGGWKGEPHAGTGNLVAAWRKG